MRARSRTFAGWDKRTGNLPARADRSYTRSSHQGYLARSYPTHCYTNLFADGAEATRPVQLSMCAIAKRAERTLSEFVAGRSSSVRCCFLYLFLPLFARKASRRGKCGHEFSIGSVRGKAARSRLRLENAHLSEIRRKVGNVRLSLSACA